MRILSLIALFTFTASATEPPIKGRGSIDDGEVQPQIVQGGAWETELQVVNTGDDGVPVPYTISIFVTAAFPWMCAFWMAMGATWAP